MTAVYLDSYTVEAYLVDTWTDITSDVITDPISCEWGISNNTAVDLMADAGTMTFTLNNVGDEYIPGHTSAVTGWGINTPVRLNLTYEGLPHYFRFYVDHLSVTSDKWNRKRITVSCVDYLEFMARAPLRGQTVVATQRADEGITTLISGMQTTPQVQSYETGQETFNTIFSKTTTSTKVYSEVSKLVNSEFGHFYKTCDHAYGETLVFEDRNHRHGLRTLDLIPISDGTVLLMETDDNLLLETGDMILLNEAEDAVFDNSMTNVEIQYGEDIVNYFMATAYPTTVTAGASTLWDLTSPMEIGGGKTITFRTNYRDPDGGNQINCLTSEATGTTHSFRPNADGSGANLDAFLSVTATFGAEGVEFTLKSTHSIVAYVTALTATGTGLLTYAPIFKEVESTVSQGLYDLRPQSIDMPYQQDPDLGLIKGATIIALEKNPRLDLQKVTFYANRSLELMYAFLYVDVGHLVHIKEDDSEIDGYYYVQGVDFMIEKGGLIRFTWTVALALSLISGGLTPVAIEFGGEGSGDGIFYGTIPEIIDQKSRTFAAWVYIAPSDGLKTIFSLNSYGTRLAFHSDEDEKLTFTTQNFDTGQGRWVADDAHPTNTWFHVAVTHDVSVDAKTDPIIYINGSAVAITETITPTGVYRSEAGSGLGIGFFYYFLNYDYIMDGKIADPRFHNVILTSAELTTLYNAGDPDSSLVTRGLVFQGFNVRTADYSGILDTDLTSTDKLIDNIYSAVGTPDSSYFGTGGTDGSPTLRVFP